MNPKSIMFYGMIAVIVILSIYLIFWTNQEGYKCMNSPLVYGVRTLSNNNQTVTCSCSAEGNDKTLIVTKDNISYLSPNSIVIPKTN